MQDVQKLIKMLERITFLLKSYNLPIRFFDFLSLFSQIDLMLELCCLYADFSEFVSRNYSSSGIYKPRIFSIYARKSSSTSEGYNIFTLPPKLSSQPKNRSLISTSAVTVKCLSSTALKELKTAGADEVIFEYEHGDAKTKKQLQMLLDIAKEGDTIITLEVSRLSRSTQQLCELIEIIRASICGWLSLETSPSTAGTERQTQ